MKKNTLATLPVKKIKIAPHSRNKHKKCPPTIKTITSMMEQCTLSDSPTYISFSEPHYGIIPVVLDFENMKSNYRKNTTFGGVGGGVDNLYILMTKLYLSVTKPPTIDIYPGDLCQCDSHTMILQVADNFKLYIQYNAQLNTNNKNYKLLRYIDFYNHYVESYDDMETKGKEIEKNPYRAIMNNRFWKKGRIRDIDIQMMNNGEVCGKFGLALLYSNIMEYVETKFEK